MEIIASYSQIQMQVAAKTAVLPPAFVMGNRQKVVQPGIWNSTVLGQTEHFSTSAT